jgi:signal transduction histidine kinase/ligand-binding sensor domain-containing protein
LLLCSFIVLSSQHLAALDPQQPIGQLHHTSWTAKDGLSGVVMALAQTTDGYLWVATTDRLYRFDGFTFEAYQPESGSFPSNLITVLLAARDGGLWIGYEYGGVSVLKNGSLTNFSDREGFPIGTVRDLTEDNSRNIWAAAVGGLARFDGNKWRSVREGWSFPGKSATALRVDRQGTLWVNAPKEGVFFLPNGKNHFLRADLPNDASWSFIGAQDGTLWLWNSEVLNHYSSAATFPGTSQEQTAFTSNNIIVDRDGSLWMSSAQDGVFRVPHPGELKGTQVDNIRSRAEAYGEKDGLTGNFVTVVMEDREGNIWVGTTGGLDQFRNRNLTWINLDFHGFNTALIAADHGEIWAASERDPLTSVQSHRPVPGAPERVSLGRRDFNGDVLLAASNAKVASPGVAATSLFRWRKGQFIPVRLPDQKPPPSIESFTNGQDDRLWISILGRGVFQRHLGAWSFVPILSVDPDLTAFSMLADATGKVWFGYPERKAIGLWDNGQTRRFTSADGLDVGSVTKMVACGQQVWVAGDLGLAFFRDGRFHSVRLADRSRIGSVGGLICTRSNGVWLSTSSSILHFPESEVESVLRQSAHPVNAEVFDVVSDLPGPLAPPELSSVAVEGSDGALWFASRLWVARIVPDHILRNHVPPPISIRAVKADHVTYSVHSSPTLPALTKNLQIDYAALSLAIPQRIRYRVRLSSVDDDWQDAGARTQAFYNNLAPGKYIFRVVACNNDGIWNDVGASFAFTILPAWYQTKSFLLACVAMGTLVVFLAYRLRIQNLRQEAQARYDDRLAERTRIAREIHDTLLQTLQGSKMLADAALSQLSNEDEIQPRLQMLSNWLSNAINEGRAALRSLRAPALEERSLETLFQDAIEDCTMTSKMQTSFQVLGEPRPLPPCIREEVFRIGYEAINNACLHSGGANLDVTLEYANDFKLRVKDNGGGIDREVLPAGRTGHFGLAGMRERASFLRASLVFTSLDGGGTEVILTLPREVLEEDNRPSVWTRFRRLLRGE